MYDSLSRSGSYLNTPVYLVQLEFFNVLNESLGINWTGRIIGILQALSPISIIEYIQAEEASISSITLKETGMISERFLC